MDSEALRQQILDWGAHVVGFGDVSRALVPELRHLPIAIAIAVANGHSSETVLKNGPVMAYTHQSSAVEVRLEQIQRRITRTLRRAGARFFPIPPNSHRPDRRFAARLYPLFPHKTAATCAGLGWVGKSGLLINRRYGPRLTWATVLTNTPLSPDRPVRDSLCAQCTRCIDSCPSGAIRGQRWRRALGNTPIIDLGACAAHLKKNHATLGQAVCGVCVLVCPFGQTKKNHNHFAGQVIQ
ncbi:MAG: 4Fe-4S double cluster binding domain-containing protein [Anaerolineae bacterium]